MANLFGDDSDDEEDKSIADKIKDQKERIARLGGNTKETEPTIPKQQNPPAFGGFAGKKSGLENMFASKLAMGMGGMGGMGMMNRPPQRNTEEQGANEAIKTENYQTLLEKKTIVVSKKKPKKKAFGASGGGDNNSQTVFQQLGGDTASVKIQVQPAQPAQPVTQAKPNLPPPKKHFTLLDDDEE